MNTGVSEKDKRLLYIIGILAFIVLFTRFALMPAWQSCETAQTELEAAQATRTDIEYNITLLDSARADVTRSQAELADAIAPLHGILSNDAIDTLVTGLAIRHGLLPVSLDISDPVTTPLAAFIASARRSENDAAAAGAGVSAEEQAEATERLNEMYDTFFPEGDGTGSSADGAQAYTGQPAAPLTPDETFVQTVSIHYSGRGTLAQFLALVDDLAANYPAMRLASFDISEETQMNADQQLESAYTFDYTMELYMCDKAGEAS